MTPAEKIERYRATYGKAPTAQWLSVACKISPEDAEHYLGNTSTPQTQKAPADPPAVVELPGSPIPAETPAPAVAGSAEDARDIEQAAPVAHQEAHGLIGTLTRWIVLGFATTADLGLAIFFYWSLGFDLPSKIALSVWGFVMTSGKVWAWTNRRNVLAVWAAALSVVATVSVFLAVIDTQSASVQAVAVNEQVETLKSQIAGKEADGQVLRQRLADTPVDYSTAAQRLTSAIAENDSVLAQMRQELAAASVFKVEEKRFELDAWKIFSQLTNFAWNDPSHVFALVIVLAISILFEMFIYATAPKGKI